MADEEARARATLAEMQMRLLQGPHVALGIRERASAEEVRGAFLQLTKQFHPARFGRMASEIHRLSNEVFLGIKAAHDAMMKAVGGAHRATQSGNALPALPAEGTASARTTGLVPAQTRPSTTAAIPAQTRPTTTGSIPVQTRHSTTGSVPVERPPSVPPAGLARGTERPTERSGAPTVSRTATPTQQPRTITPPLGAPIARAPSPPVMRPVTPTGRPPLRPPTASPGINPDTVRGTAAPREPAFDERAALREALMQLNEQNWAAARQLLHNLAAKVPQSKNYRALLGYARGREAQAAGKLDEAMLEYQRALQVDPDLAVAKQALADVQRRR